MSRILVIDDDQALCRSLEIHLEGEGHEVRSATTGGDGLRVISEWDAELVFLDLQLPDRSGLEILRELEGRLQELPVVMITGTQDAKATIEAMRQGAADYIRKPISMDDLLLSVEKAHRARRSGSRTAISTEGSDQAGEIIGRDRKIVEILKQIGQLSRSNVTVLIEGESGTGKELVARALHWAARPDTPFVAINCSSIVSTIPESELFGHERGAFTGADRRKIGKLEHASSGTVFLDEIGDLAPELQAKMLRVLQEREFERVGGLESRPFNARVVAATNRDLAAMTRDGRFREDLYFRLAVTRIHVPPLRERREDIPDLVTHLAVQIARRVHCAPPEFDQHALSLLKAYDWPGNIRELENVLTRAIALSASGAIGAEDLRFSLGEARREDPASPTDITTLREAEKAHVLRALEATGWNMTQTARLLDISPTTLRKKISDYKLR